jgi:hypothetical protein
VRHACRESFYFIVLNVLRSVGGIACGRDADPLFTLLQAVEMCERTDFSDGTRMCGLRMCVVSHFRCVVLPHLVYPGTGLHNNSRYRWDVIWYYSSLSHSHLSLQLINPIFIVSSRPKMSF